MATAPKIQYSEKYFDKEFEYRSGSTLLTRAFTRLYARRQSCGTDGRDCGSSGLHRHLPFRHPAADRRGRVRSPPDRLSPVPTLVCGSYPLPRHVVLPAEVARLVPKGKLLSENEWRQLGVQQSRGWVHYAIHRCPRPRHLRPGGPSSSAKTSHFILILIFVNMGYSPARKRCAYERIQSNAREFTAFTDTDQSPKSLCSHAKEFIQSRLSLSLTSLSHTHTQTRVPHT
jgi:hypothetical protein